MDIDFHYYGTYTAARAAGFSPSEATVIAHAAQYVDDSSLERLVDPATYAATQILSTGLGYRIRSFTPVPTFHTEGELVQMESRTAWTLTEINMLRRVWSVFHFLPGNYEGNPGTREYSGSTTWEKWPFKYEYDAGARTDFKLLCLPNSRLVEEMVNHSRLHFSQGGDALHLAGIRMHVLGDTWAHTYHAGSPNYWVNDAGQTVERIEENGRRQIRWKTVGAWGTVFDDDCEVASPPNPFVRSIFYLGHGRMGHLPDYPWMRYAYGPKWSNTELIKDNPGDYMKGFNQMVTALRCLRTGQEFRVVDVGQAPPDCTEAVAALIAKGRGIGDPMKRCAQWRQDLERMHIGGEHAGVPPVYDPDLWERQTHGNYEDKSANYYLFNRAARTHHDHVIERLKKHTQIDLNQEDNGFAAQVVRRFDSTIKAPAVYVGREIASTAKKVWDLRPWK